MWPSIGTIIRFILDAPMRDGQMKRQALAQNAFSSVSAERAGTARKINRLQYSLIISLTLLYAG